MTTRQKVAVSLAAFHMLLIGLSVTNMRIFAGPDPVSQTVNLYGDLSGANNGYGFFAPGVGPQYRTVFVMTDARGRTWRDTLDLGKTREAGLRFTGISTLLASVENDEMRSRVLQSMAATMFGRHPQAKSVAVRLEVLGVDRIVKDENGEVIRDEAGKPMLQADFPSMSEYADGVRPNWLPLWPDIVFTRGASESPSSAAGR